MKPKTVRNVRFTWRVVMFTATGAIVAVSVPKVALPVGVLTVVGAVVLRRRGNRSATITALMVAATVVTLLAVGAMGVRVDHTDSQVLPGHIYQCNQTPVQGC